MSLYLSQLRKDPQGIVVLEIVSFDCPEDGAKVLTVLQPRLRVERRLLIRIEPEYPEPLKLGQIAGTVRLALTISPKGSVDNVQVIGGNPILAEAAIKAVQQWVYAAAPSRTTMEVSISFDPHH